MHAVHKLYLYRKSLATREFKARGWRVERCPTCRIDQRFCTCDLVQTGKSNAAFALLMYDNEVLKPSNTGRLIADVIPDTHAFIWQRSQIDEQLQALLDDPKYQAYLVFPKEYASEQQVVHEGHLPDLKQSKIPLFILIDATWRQAKKIFRKSPYLQSLPIISIGETPDSNALQSSASLPVNTTAECEAIELDNAPTNDNDASELDNFGSRYNVRKAAIAGQLATAEVAAKVLTLVNDNVAAQHLDLWFDVFCYQYQKGVKQINKGNPQAIQDYQKFIKEHF